MPDRYPDDATRYALDMLLQAGWEIVLMRHVDRSRDAPNPGAHVVTVTLRSPGSPVIRGTGPYIGEALRVTARKAEEALAKGT